MAMEQKKVNLFFRPAGIIISLVFVFLIISAIVLAINYSEDQQIEVAADRIAQGLSRLKTMASTGQMINNRVPRSYQLILRDCQQNCFYELGVTTAEGQEIILEKVFLGDIYLKVLQPQGGVARASFMAGEADQLAPDASLIEIGSLLIRRRLTGSFSASGHFQPADFKSFKQKLPEAYLPWLTVGSLATIEITTSTNAGIAKSVGIYWQKDGGFSQLDVKLSQTSSTEQKVLRSEIRDFDSSLATICFDLPSSDEEAAYLATLEPQGTAEGVKNISLRVFKEYDCRGDNLASGIDKVEIIKK